MTIYGNSIFKDVINVTEVMMNYDGSETNMTVAPCKRRETNAGTVERWPCEDRAKVGVMRLSTKECLRRPGARLE